MKIYLLYHHHNVLILLYLKRVESVPQCTSGTITRITQVWSVIMTNLGSPLQWRHDERDGVWNHQPRDCFFHRLFMRRSRKTSKLRVTGLCAGNSPVIGEFPAQRTSNAGMFPFDDVIMQCQHTYITHRKSQSMSWSLLCSHHTLKSGNTWNREIYSKLSHQNRHVLIVVCICVRTTQVLQDILAILQK